MTDTIVHKGRTYTLARPYIHPRSTETQLRKPTGWWVEENRRCIRLPVLPAGDQAANHIRGDPSRANHNPWPAVRSGATCSRKGVVASYPATPSYDEARSVYRRTRGLPVIDDGALYEVEEVEGRRYSPISSDYLRWESRKCLADLVEDQGDATLFR